MLVLAILVIAGLFIWLILSNNRTTSQLRELRQQDGSNQAFTDSETGQLNELQAKTEALEQKLSSGEPDLEVSEEAAAAQPAEGAPGATGARGPQGATGTAGAQGVAGSNDCISGVCVSRQNGSPGIQETGSINIAGDGLFGGNVGVGTLNPSAKLDVNGTMAAHYGAGAWTGAATSWYMGSLPYDGSSTFEKLKIEVFGGRAGLGYTGTTTYMVNSRGGLEVTREVHGGASWNHTLKIYDNGTGYDVVIETGAGASSNYNYRTWKLVAGNTLKETIPTNGYNPGSFTNVTPTIIDYFATSTGNVGIGTTAPVGQLHVQSSAASKVGLIVRGAASQSADALQVQNSAGAVLVSISAAGHLTVPSAKLSTVAAKPACDATARGQLWYTQGGGGVKDALEVCAKDVGGSYAWRTIY